MDQATPTIKRDLVAKKSSSTYNKKSIGVKHLKYQDSLKDS